MSAQKGIQVIRGNHLGGDTSDAPGMKREAGVSPETTGNQSLWMGPAGAPAGTVTGWHHHGDCETGIYVLKGSARFHWGQGGAENVEVGPGDFVAVAPNAVHREETVGNEEAVFVVARACGEVTTVEVDEPEPE